MQPYLNMVNKAAWFMYIIHILRLYCAPLSAIISTHFKLSHAVFRLVLKSSQSLWWSSYEILSLLMRSSISEINMHANYSKVQGLKGSMIKRWILNWFLLVKLEKWIQTAIKLPLTPVNAENSLCPHEK